MKNNDIDGLDWLREIRKQIVTECGNNAQSLGEYYRNIQQGYATKMRIYSAFQKTKELSKPETPDQIVQPDPEPVLM